MFDTVLYCVFAPSVKHLQVEQYPRYGISKLMITLDIGVLLAFAFGFSH